MWKDLADLNNVQIKQGSELRNSAYCCCHIKDLQLSLGSMGNCYQSLQLPGEGHTVGFNPDITVQHIDHFP